MNTKPMRFWLAAFAVASLAACNGNDQDPVATTTPTPSMQADSFTTIVATDVKASSDDTEPKDIDAVVLATADDAEPVTVN